MGPFAKARIYQGVDEVDGDQPSYFPDAQQLMAQVKNKQQVNPEWLTGPFVPPRIYQGVGDMPSYFPDANQFMP